MTAAAYHAADTARAGLRLLRLIHAGKDTFPLAHKIRTVSLSRQGDVA
jgi:hypothetical protein